MNDIVKYRNDYGGEVTLSAEIVKKYLVQGSGEVSDQEVGFFIALCQARGLDPFLRDAYLIKYKETIPASIVVSVDVLRRRVAMHPATRSISMGVVVQKGEEEPVYRQDAIVPRGYELIGAWCEIERAGWSKPVRAAVNLKEFIQVHLNKKTGKVEVNSAWAKMPAVMLTKCAFATAARMAYPEHFQGAYIPEEMGIDAPHDIIEDGEVAIEQDAGGDMAVSSPFSTAEEAPPAPAPTPPRKAEEETPAPEPPLATNEEEEPDPEPPPVTKEDKERDANAKRAMFAALGEYANALRKAKGIKGSSRAEAERHLREEMEQRYGLFSVKSLDYEQTLELIDWVKSKTASLMGEEDKEA